MRLISQLGIIRLIFIRNQREAGVKTMSRTLSVKVNGKELEVNDFVRRAFSGLIVSFVEELHTDDEKIEQIAIEVTVQD